MTKYWAIDYVDDNECELVIGDQLYQTEEMARWALAQREDAEHYEVNWYTCQDLEDTVYCIEDQMILEIDKDLQVHVWNK